MPSRAALAVRPPVFLALDVEGAAELLERPLHAGFRGELWRRIQNGGLRTSSRRQRFRASARMAQADIRRSCPEAWAGPQATPPGAHHQLVE
jgi:hypothetical protein